MTTTCFIRLLDGPYAVNALQYEPDPEKIDWPAPERIIVLGLQGQPRAIIDADRFVPPEGKTQTDYVIYRKRQESKLPESAAVEMTHVARGVEYELEHDGLAE